MLPQYEYFEFLMARFAQGRLRYIRQSGFRYKYKDMRKSGMVLLLAKMSLKQNSHSLSLSTVVDALALKDARPDRTEPQTVPVGPGGFQKEG